MSKVTILGHLVNEDTFILLRDWSLITGRGATKQEGGHMKFYSYEKGGGGGKSFSHANRGRGDTTSLGVVFAQ